MKLAFKLGICGVLLVAAVAGCYYPPPPPPAPYYHHHHHHPHGVYRPAVVCHRSWNGVVCVHR